MNIPAPLPPSMPEPSASDEASSISQTAQTLLRLRELVLSGDLPTGARIAELALVDRLGVSRTPIRAALQRLELEGLLEGLPNGGYRVRQFDLADIEDAIELRGVMEGLAARMAAERGITPEQQMRARELLVCMDVVLSEPAFEDEQYRSFVERNLELHRLLADMCGSRIIQQQMERIHSLPFAAPGAFVGVTRLFPPGTATLRISHEQHHAMVDAISRREGARAEALAQEHARRARQNLLLVMKHRATDLVSGGALIRRAAMR